MGRERPSQDLETAVASKSQVFEELMKVDLQDNYQEALQSVLRKYRGQPFYEDAVKKADALIALKEYYEKRHNNKP